MGHDVGEVDIDNVSLVAGHVGTENLNLAAQVDTGTDTGVDTGVDITVRIQVLLRLSWLPTVDLLTELAGLVTR